MPRGFSEQEKEIIRRRLLDAGRAAFGRYGIKKTSVEELARMAGISKGAFYGFFESKEELFFRVMREYESTQHQQILSALSSAQGSPAQAFKQLLGQLFSEAASDPFTQRLLDGEDLLAVMQKLSPEQASEAIQADMDLASKLLALWRARGQLKTDNPALISGALRAVFFMYQYRQHIGNEVFEDVISLMLDAVIDRLISD